jgi:hypothetical protein
MFPNKTTQAYAEQSCNDQGGHLAYYSSLAEQAEVEQYYISNGYLMPTYTPAYWIGMRTNKTGWPRFDWMQRVTYAQPNRDNDRWVACGRRPRPGCFGCCACRLRPFTCPPRLPA